MHGSDLAAALGAVEVRGLERLSGGASRETWRFDAVRADGTVDRLVLRRDPPGRPTVAGTMTNEADAMRACLAACRSPRCWPTTRRRRRGSRRAW